MSAESRKTQVFDPSLLDQLACPACQGALRYGPQRLVCESCGRGYPIIDGIPVLIAERAVSSK
ncbi:MAG: Trm112 family protein [Terracidiphilus sp.]